ISPICIISLSTLNCFRKFAMSFLFIYLNSHSRLYLFNNQNVIIDLSLIILCCICTYSRLEVSEFNKICGRGFRLEQNILFSSNQYGLAEIILTIHKAINSLTYDMLEPLKEKLIEWEKNPEIKVIILKGAGEKGFCAGGDMKTLYDAGQNGDAIKKGD